MVKRLFSLVLFTLLSVLPATAQGPGTEHGRLSVNDLLTFRESAGDATCATGDYWLKGNSSTNTLRGCENGNLFDANTAAGAASWSSLTNPTAVTTFTSGAVAEIMSYDFQANYTTEQLVLFKTSTGTPSGGTLLTLEVHDADVLPFAISDGSSNVFTVARTGNVRLTAMSAPSYAAGNLFYDSGNESLTFHNNEPDIALQVGQEMWVRVRNESGVTISNGQVVYIDGLASGLPRIALAQSNAAATSEAVGLVTHDIENLTNGYVTAFGLVRDFDTSAFTIGDRLFLSPTTAGALTATVPSDPNFSVPIGIVTEVNVSTGDILVTLGPPRPRGDTGIAVVGGDLRTASTEEGFLNSGPLTCGASTAGSMRVHTTPLQYCDNAATPVLQYAAYGASDGDALAGDSATSFFDAGTLEDTRLSANVALATDTLDFFAATTSAEFLGIISNETGTTGLVVASINPTLTDVTVDDLITFTETAGDATCAAGDYWVKGNSTSNKMRGCENGTAFDLNTAGGGNSFGTIGNAVADSGADTLTVTDSGTIDFTTTDNPEDLTAIVIADSITATQLDETVAYAFSSITNTFFGASYTDGSGAAPSAGVLRCANAVSCIAAEAAPAGADGTITYDATEQWAFNSPIVVSSGGTDQIQLGSGTNLSTWQHTYIEFEGATDDGFETRFSITDPTADRTVTVPNVDTTIHQPFSCTNQFARSSAAATGLVTCATVAASEVTMSRIAGSTFSTAEDMQIVFHSAGWTTGGTINDAGAGNITVDAGTGLVRSTDSSVGTMLWFDWSALGSTAIPADTVRYVGVEYNAGSPQIVVRTTYTWDFNTDFPLGNVVNEGGTLHIENAPHAVGDHANFMVQRMYETSPRKRDDRSGGLIIGETGTRNVTVSAGSVWERLQTFAITAIDTSVADSFDTYCTTTKEATGATQWDNANYCNSGTLTALTSNRYAALWFYLELDGALLMVYGNAQYTSQAAAEDDPQPVTVPNRISAQALLIGRMIINEGDATALSIESAFTKAFAAATITDHGELAGLGDDDHTQYGLLAGRSGGQTLIGGTGAGDDLHLQTTSNASKGTYFLDELTTNGFLKTGGGNGTLSVATNVALASDTLDFFAATTSAEFLGTISNETGTTGLVVASINPTLTDVTINDLITFTETAGDATCAVGDYWVKGNSTSNTMRGCENGNLFDVNTTAGAASWSSLTDPTAAVTMNSGAVSELLQFNYTAAYGGTDVLFQIEQLTGNPVAGSILLELVAADTDILLLSAGSGSNTIDITQAGAMSAQGTATITATDLAADAIDATTDFAAGLCVATQILERQASVWACIATPSGGGARWDELTAPTSSIDLVSSADAELFTMDFQSNFSTDRVVIQDSTGNPTGGTLLQVTVTDPQVEGLRVEKNTTDEGSFFNISNSNTASRAFMRVISDTAQGGIAAYGSTHATAADETWFWSAGASGKLLIRQDGAKPIEFWTNGSEQGTISSAGAWTIGGSLEAGTLTEGGVNVVVDTLTLTGGNGIATLGDLSANRTVAIDLLTADDQTGSSSNQSGLEFGDTGSDKLALLRGCALDDVLKFNTTGGLWECATDVSGGTPRWDQITDPTAVTVFNSGATAELFQMNFTAAYGATNVLVDLEQLTGNPVAGSVLLGLTAADADILLLSAGGFTIDQAGAAAGPSFTGTGSNGVIEFPNSAAANAGANVGRLRYDSASQDLQLSRNTGGYIALVVESRLLTGGNGIATLGDLSADRTVAIDLLTADDQTGSSSNQSGLEFGDTGSDKLGLLRACANGQILKFNTTGGLWACQNDDDSGGSPTLDSIIAAAGTASINSGDNAIVWNWQLTTASKNAFEFTENVAGTATTDAVLVQIATLAASTVHPLEVTARGDINGIRVGATDGILVELGTGGVDFGALLNYPTACSATFVRAILDSPTCEAVSLTADVNGILPGANGGTNNGFMDFTGPATSLKTFTLPNATATILTDNADVTVAQGGTGISVGTSGGIPYFSSTTTIASSALLTANALVLGGGAGATPSTPVGLGTTTTLLHGNAGGAPSYAVVTASDTDETTFTGVTWGANADFVWNYNTVGGANPDSVFSFTGANINVSTGTLQEGGVAVSLPARSETLTNKTLDAEATGNALGTVSKTYIDAASCIGATATNNWDDAGTGDTAPTAACNDTGSIQRPSADFAGGAVNSFERTMRLPSDWASGLAVDVSIRYVTVAASPTGNVEWDISTICRAAGETWDAAFNTAQTITDAAAAQNVLNDADQASVTMTTCAADEDWSLKISRDGTNDTNNDLAKMMGVMITLRRTQ